MVDPYRSPAELDPSSSLCPLGRYAGPGNCSGCERFVPEPERFYSRTAGAPPAEDAPAPRSAPLFVKAASMAALMLLGSASAALCSLAWTVAHQHEVRPAPIVQRPAPAAAMAAAGAAPWRARARHWADRHPLLADPTPPAGPLFDLPHPPPSLNDHKHLTHNPTELWRRAQRQADTDPALVLHEVKLSAESLAEGQDLSSTRVMPAKWPLGGLKILRISPGSAFSQAGLVEGDVLLAINGYAMDDPALALEAYETAKRRRAAVIELMRGKQAVVLKVALGSNPR